MKGRGERLSARSQANRRPVASQRREAERIQAEVNAISALIDSSGWEANAS